MARSRNIKPGFFMNDELAEIQPLGRLLFAGLWTIADREGRLIDRPKKIKAEVLPYDDCDIEKLLQNLTDKTFIVRYSVGNENYIQITNWQKHQKPHIKEATSIIPPISQDKTQESTGNSGASMGNSDERIPDSLSLDSLSLDSLTTDSFNSNLEKEPTAAEVVKKFETVFGRTFNSFEVEKLKEWIDKYPGSIILYALKTATLNNKYKFNYIDGILFDWDKNNLKTLFEIMDYEKEFKKRREKRNSRAAPDNSSGDKKEKIRSLYTL